MCWKPFIAFGFCVLFSLLCSPAYGSGKILKARVTTDGAMVFRRPTFESDVIAYLQMGENIRVTRKTRGGFHKVKIKSGKVGFIRVEDVQAEGESPAKSSAKPPKPEEILEQEKDPFQKDIQDEELPFLYQKYAGLLLGMVNYSEGILGRSLKENLTTIGAKLSGPDILLEGPLIDMNISLSMGVPNYYSDIAGNSASGFLLLIDYRFLVPLTERVDRYFYFAAGPMLNFSRVNVQLDDNELTMDQLHLGMSFGTGVAMRLGHFCVRAEANYNWEVSRYFSLGGALQYKF